MRLFISIFAAVSCFAATFHAITNPPVLAFEARGSRYVSHGPGYALAVSSTSAALNVAGHSIRMELAGATANSSLAALDRMPGKANYILGTDVRASYELFGRVQWRNAYPGIDVIFRGNQEHLEYDFDIAAGRDPRKIAIDFTGIDSVAVDRNGDLILSAGAVEIQQPRPFAYQIVGGQKRPVEAWYRIDSGNRVRFRTGRYDRKRPLVIDPQLVFEKFFGGSGTTVAFGLARDAQGALYVTGSTASTDFPTANAYQNHLGSAPLLASANGGQTWTFPTIPSATVVNMIAAAPSAPLTLYASTAQGIFKSTDGGSTWTAAADTGLPGTPGLISVDASSPGVVYATTTQGVYISTDSGSSWRLEMSFPYGSPAHAIAASPFRAGTVYLSLNDAQGLYRSTDYGQTWTPLTVPQLYQRASATEILFDANGGIVLGSADGIFKSTDAGNTWTTLSTQLEIDTNQGIAFSPKNPNLIYLVSNYGVVRSTDGGVTFTTVTPSGVKFSGFSRVAVDPNNPSTAYFTDDNILYRTTDSGQTWTQRSLPYSIFPQTIFVSPAGSRLFLGTYTQNNVFVTKWSADGSQILYSTYIGGNGSDTPRAIAVDGNGSAYVTGHASSPNFPTTPGAFQPKPASPQDIFVAKLSADGSKLLYSTFLGSTNTNAAAIAVDNSGEAVLTGSAGSSFPTTANAYQSAPVSGCSVQIPVQIPIEIGTPSGDAFITKMAADGTSLVYSTLLGGSCTSYGNGVAIDANGNAWIAGTTISPDFPVTSDALQPKTGGGYYDGFLARFNSAGGLDYATYLGGAGYDAMNAIAFDSAGNIFVTGQSDGLLQPASPGAFQAQVNAFCLVLGFGTSFNYPTGNGVVVKLDPPAHNILRLTYFGAPGCLSPSSIAVDAADEPYIAGNFTTSSTFPTVNPVRIGSLTGYVSKFSADFTQLLFSTYFDSVGGLAVDASGLAYLAGTQYPPSGMQQAYIAKIDPAPAAISLDSIASFVPSGDQSVAPGQVIRLLGRKMGPPQSTAGIINSGVLATNVAGVQVTFDGAVVPLLSVSAQEIDLVAPFELAGKTTTTVQVNYNGAQSNAVIVTVVPIAPQIHGVYNQDFSANSQSNPAKPASGIMLYISGVGQTDPPSQDGQVNSAPFAPPAMPIQILDSALLTPLPIAWIGAAPNLAAGIFQLNFAAPPQTTNLTLMVGNYQVASFNVWVSP